MTGILHLIGIAALAASLAPSLSAGEFAVLKTGYRLHADRHEQGDGTVRLYSNGGMTELPAGSVTGFEPDEAVAPPAPAMPAPATNEIPEAKPAPLPVMTPQEMAGAAARKYALPEGFIRSVMKAESGFQPAALSPKGAIGLMQLMPDTAKALGVDPKDPRQNAEGGAQYLHDLLAKYENDPNQVLLALAAYNAGPGAVEHYHGVPPYKETREYILRVLKNWDQRVAPPEAGAAASSGN